MQTEEGFYQAATYITEEQAFRTSRIQPNSSNIYGRVLNRSPLINHRIRTEWMLKIYEKYQQSIVYNAIRNDLVSGLVEGGLRFDGDFESGNLDLVVRQTYKQYNLYMRHDTNTLGHCQWFNFKVRSSTKNRRIKLHIKNFGRGIKLYQDGMRPYFRRTNKGTDDQWKQLPQSCEVSFENNEVENEEGQCTLTFSYSFGQDGEEVQFCTQPPYTYEQLKIFLSSLSISISSLGESLLGLKIHKVAIGGSGKIEGVGLAIARQHPGQPVGSWMMQGFLQKIKQLNDQNFLWVIIPMVNVDGVVLGNNRTGIVGYDLNRQYDEKPKSEQFLEVSYILDLVKKMKKKYGKLFQMFIDFHGHSSKKNVFSYGPPILSLNEDQTVSARLFPKLIALKNPLYSFEQSTYVIPKCKTTTARSVLFNKHKLTYCYTIEASYGLADHENKRLKVDDLIRVGEDIAQASLDFLNFVAKQSPINTPIQNIVQILKEQLPIVKQNIQKEESQDSSYDGSVADLEEQERQEVNYHIRRMKKAPALSSTNDRHLPNIRLSNRVQTSTIQHMTVKDLQKFEQNKGSTFVSRSMRKDFRWKRATELRNNLYLNDSTDVNIEEVAHSLNMVPLQSNLRLKFPSETRRGYVQSQRRFLADSNQQVHLKTEREQKKRPSMPQPDQDMKRWKSDREYFIREIMKNKRNRVGTKLLIINEM